MKLKIIILTITTICVLLSCKETEPIAVKQMQDNNTEFGEIELDSESFDITYRNPEFPGGDNELLNYISNNLKYPESAKENGISGRVSLLLTINEKGEIADVKIIRGICPELDEEAVRLVKAMPKWEPGYENEKAKTSYLMLPINFKL